MNIRNQKYNRTIRVENDLSISLQTQDSNESPFNANTIPKLLIDESEKKSQLKDQELICNLPSVEIFSMLVQHEITLNKEINSKVSNINYYNLQTLQKVNNGIIFQLHDSMQSVLDLIFELNNFDLPDKESEINNVLNGEINDLENIHKLLLSIIDNMKNKTGNLTYHTLLNPEIATDYKNNTNHYMVDFNSIESDLNYCCNQLECKLNNSLLSIFEKYKIIRKYLCFIKKLIKLHEKFEISRNIIDNTELLTQPQLWNKSSIVKIRDTCQFILNYRSMVDTKNEFRDIINKVEESNIEQNLLKAIREAVDQRNVNKYRRVISELESKYETCNC